MSPSFNYPVQSRRLQHREGEKLNDGPFIFTAQDRAGIFTAWSYRAGAAGAEAFLLGPQPLTARTAYKWGPVVEVVPNGKALRRPWEWAELYLRLWK